MRRLLPLTALALILCGCPPGSSADSNSEGDALRTR